LRTLEIGKDGHIFVRTRALGQLHAGLEHSEEVVEPSTWPPSQFPDQELRLFLRSYPEIEHDSALARQFSRFVTVAFIGSTALAINGMSRVERALMRSGHGL
jgi:hypothetical protein